MGFFRKRSARAEHHYVQERLSAYLDGELSSGDRAAVDRHLSACQHCRWNLRTLRQTIQWTRELPPVPVPRAFTVPVQTRVAQIPAWRRSMPLLQGATALVAVLFFLAVAGNAYVSRMPPAAEPPPAQAVEVTGPAAESEELTYEMEVVAEGDAAGQVEELPSEPMVAAAPRAAAVEEQVVESAAEEELPPAAESGVGVTDAEVSAAQGDIEALGAGPGAEIQPTSEGEPALEQATEKPAVLEPPSASPTAEPRAVAEPTQVADANVKAAAESAAAADEVPSGVLREPRHAWLGVAEIALGLAFVLLGSVTILLMVRRLRSG